MFPRALDSRTPVLVGAGQLNLRTETAEPVDMIVDAIRLAARQAGNGAIAEHLDSIRVVGMLSWRYRDPGLLVGERLGSPVRHTVYTGAGGSHPQVLVNDAAADIAAGRCDVVAVGGAEAWRTRTTLTREGRLPDWTVQRPDLTASQWRPGVSMRDDTELRAGLDRPAFVYPLFEQALRIGAGRTSDEHRVEISRLWSRFSDVAVDNPAAWTRTAVAARTIRTPTPDNRMIAWPYPKLMNANNNVEQAAAVLVCSVEAAVRFGVPSDSWVFLRAGAEASDTAQIAARPHLDRSAAIRHAGSLALQLAELAVADLEHVDLYSCFPSAVQVAARELGLPLDDPKRPLTVTGGLTFAGGPWNNYSTHAIATMIEKVRESGRPGLVTANSGYLTKHSVGVYAATPASHGSFRRADAQPHVDREGTTRVAARYDGRADIESWTVEYQRDGTPVRAMASLRTPDGARTLASSEDPDLVDTLVTEDVERAAATVDAEARFTMA